MNIKKDLLAKAVSELIRLRMLEIEIDATEIADTTAIAALSEIQDCLDDEDLSDFQVIEAIVRVFEKYELSSGSRHDF